MRSIRWILSAVCFGKILDDKKMDDLLEVRLKAEQMLKYIEKYNVELTYKDENKYNKFHESWTGTFQKT